MFEDSEVASGSHLRMDPGIISAENDFFDRNPEFRKRSDTLRTASRSSSVVRTQSFYLYDLTIGQASPCRVSLKPVGAIADQ